MGSSDAQRALGPRRAAENDRKASRHNSRSQDAQSALGPHGGAPADTKDSCTGHNNDHQDRAPERARQPRLPTNQGRSDRALKAPGPTRAAHTKVRAPERARHPRPPSQARAPERARHPERRPTTADQQDRAPERARHPRLPSQGRAPESARHPGRSHSRQYRAPARAGRQTLPEATTTQHIEATALQRTPTRAKHAAQRRYRSRQRPPQDRTAEGLDGRTDPATTKPD